MNEFPDRLSPMLVKELRQGLRTKGFLIAFLLIQGVLALSVLVAQDTGSGGGGGSFFWILGLALVTVLPLRALGAFSSEEPRQNLDLVRLTHLSTWRIVLGKWSALVSQSTLFVTTVLPYVVLRYFVGGVNVLFDLAWVVTLLVTGSVFTAFAIAVSTVRAPVARLGAAGVIVVLGISILGFTYDEFYQGGELPGGSILAWIFSLLILAVVLLFALLSGAVPLASPSENYATPRRVTVLVGLFALLTGSWLSDPSTGGPLVVISMATALIGFVVAFAEEPRGNRVALAPTAPGWPASLPFGATCALLAAAALYAVSDVRLSPQPFSLIAFAGGAVATLLAPAAGALFARRIFSNRVAGYLCFMAITTISLVFVVTTFSEWMSIGDDTLIFAVLGSVFPPFFLGFTGNDLHDEFAPVYVAGVAAHLTIIGAVFYFCLRKLRTLRRG